MSANCEEKALDEFHRQIDKYDIKVDDIKHMIEINEQWNKNNYKVENLNIGKTICKLVIHIHQLQEEVKELKRVISTLTKTKS